MSGGFEVKLRLLENYVFELDFGDFGNIVADEPEPLGQGEGPNPARLLAASVANCLCASLLFALRKFNDNPSGLTATVSGTPERQDGRWRIAHLQVRVQLADAAIDLPHLDKALAQFEDFCVVTQSVRQGIAVDIEVVDGQGKRLALS